MLGLRTLGKACAPEPELDHTCLGYHRLRLGLGLGLPGVSPVLQACISSARSTRDGTLTLTLNLNLILILILIVTLTMTRILTLMWPRAGQCS